MRTLRRLERAIRHYIVGSVYVLVHLATHEHRARDLAHEHGREVSV